MAEVRETQKTTDPKLLQFTEELNELLERYQYMLLAQLRVTANGIAPYIATVNKIPPKKKTEAIREITKSPKEK